MADVRNNLYPPIVDTYMPAFDKDDGCKVYFSLSAYNSESDINKDLVQVTVSYQNTNQSALRYKPRYNGDTEVFPIGIALTSLKRDGDGRYYINIKSSWLADEKGFKKNEYYKVQIRFCVSNINPPEKGQPTSKWINSNLENFSEWSTVCLIKGIRKPTLSLAQFEGRHADVAELSKLIGVVNFETGEKERVSSYRIKVLDNEKTKILYDTKDIIPPLNAANQINTLIKYNFQEIDYVLRISFITNNLYTYEEDYTVRILNHPSDELNATIEAYPDSEEGRVKIKLTSLDADGFIGNITFRRMSSESNFTIWEDIKNVSIIQEGVTEIVWCDYTVKAGVKYRYGAQKRNSKGLRGTILKTEEDLFFGFEHSYLTRKNQQLKIAFNPKINSLKRNITDAKSEALGAKYAYIKRAAETDYKQFNLSGLISFEMDENSLLLAQDISAINFIGVDEESFMFHSDEEICPLEDSIRGKREEKIESNIELNKRAIYQSNYDENYANFINKDDYGSYIYERDFREKVWDFLCSDRPVLFRSSTEGNILVRLMDISLSSEAQLGRKLYSFNATAYEIDEADLESLERNEVFELQDISGAAHFEVENKYGSIADSFEANTEILNAISKKIESEYEDYEVAFTELDGINLQIQSDPYLIKSYGNDLTIVEKEDEDTIVGYIVYINDIPMYINKNGILHLAEGEYQINSLRFPTTTEAIIDYFSSVALDEKTEKEVKDKYYLFKVGQIFDMAEYDTDLFATIQNKYSEDNKSYYQKLFTLHKISIEADKGTVFYLQDNADDTLYRHVIGDTNEVTYGDEDAFITGLTIKGINLVKQADINTYNLYEYREDTNTYTSYVAIKNPLPNCIYNIKSIGKRIYYHNAWYEFIVNNDESIDVKYPVQVIVNYLAELEKGDY